MGGWVKRGGSKFEVFRSNKRQKVISHMDRGALSVRIKREVLTYVSITSTDISQ